MTTFEDEKVGTIRLIIEFVLMRIVENIFQDSMKQTQKITSQKISKTKTSFFDNFSLSISWKDMVIMEILLECIIG